MRQSEVSPAKACGHSECQFFEKYIFTLDLYLLELRRQALASQDAYVDLLSALNAQNSHATFRSFTAFCHHLNSAALIAFPQRRGRKDEDPIKYKFTSLRGRWIRCLLSLGKTDAVAALKFTVQGEWEQKRLKSAFKNLTAVRNTITHFDERLDDCLVELKSVPHFSEKTLPRYLPMTVQGYTDENYGTDLAVYYDYVRRKFVYYGRSMKLEELHSLFMFFYELTDVVINGDADVGLFEKSKYCILKAEKITGSRGLNTRI